MNENNIEEEEGCANHLPESVNAVTNRVAEVLASEITSSNPIGDGVGERPPAPGGQNGDHRDDTASKLDATLELITDDIGPQLPPSMLTDSNPPKEPDLVKQITSQNGPEIIDDNVRPEDFPASMFVDSLQVSSITKKIAPSQAEITMPTVPFGNAAAYEGGAAMNEHDALLSNGGESIVMGKSRTSSTWFIRENSRSRERAPSWGGRWLPVILRQNARENWQKLKNFDIYLVPSNAGVEVEYMNSEDAINEDEESPEAGTGIFIDDAEDDADGNPPSTNAAIPLLDQEENNLMPVIPEAFLVQDNNIDIVEAEPLLPWWKQTRAIVSVVCLVLVAVFIAVVVTARANGSQSIPETGIGPVPCVSVEIEVTLFNSEHPTQHAWKLSRLDAAGNHEVINTYEGTDGDTFHNESVCVPRGVVHEFNIQFDTNQVVGGGTCCEGQYRISSDEQLIVQGDEFWQQYLEVKSRFSIPYDDDDAIRT